MSKTAHSKTYIQQALAHPDDHQSSGKYLSDSVYGALDGMVTTFAIVAGVVGADLSLNVILILGLANLFADGFSMAAGSYLAIKSERDYHREEYNREKWEIENYPEGEIEEIRQIYRAKGFTGKDLDQAVKIITSNKEQWLKTMMVEELHIIQENKSPWIVAISTFLAFLICGAIPLLAYAALYFFPTLQISTFTISIIATACTIFIVGSLRSIFIAKHWLPAGLEMLLIGGSASTVAYLVGYLLRGLA